MTASRAIQQRVVARPRHEVIVASSPALLPARASRTRRPEPAWFHNLLAHPDVTFGGISMRATVVDDEAERRRLWTLADRVFAPYATYRRDAAKSGRRIPIVQLTERTEP